MKPLKVSILIPAYNSEEWIADTLQSAGAQSWPRKEIIVVDDGSSDRTAEVARRFASKQVVVVSTLYRTRERRRLAIMHCDSARGTTFSGWTRTTCLCQIRSSGNLQLCGKLIADESFFPRHGLPSTIGLGMPALFVTPCGKIFLRSTGF